MQNFHSDVSLAFSTKKDGSMASGAGQPTILKHVRNADDFLHKYNFPKQRNRILVTYGDDRTYIDIERVDEQNNDYEIVADAVYTTVIGRAITLPVADCVATVVYDPVTGMLGVLHLGRHSSVAGLIEHFVVEVADMLGSDPRDWHVWMSPSLDKKNHRLDYFNVARNDEWKDFAEQRTDGFYIDMAGHNKERFKHAGVPPTNIIVSAEDTYDNANYFSHRASQSGKLAKQGRMMVAVYKRQ